MKILHFRTWISLRPVGQSWSNFMCSITGVGRGCIMFWGRLDKNWFPCKRKPPLHTCHKLWIEICEMRQIFKGDLIKLCEIFTKITLELPQSSQKPLFKCKKLVINTTTCDLCLFLHKMCCKIVWKVWDLKNLMGIGFQMGKILWDFISQCEIWHVCHWLIMGKMVSPPFFGCFWSDPFYTCR